jgi:hypothetical protein
MNLADLLLIGLRFWLFGAVVYLGIRHWNAKEVSIDIRALGAWGISGFLLTIAFFTGNWLLITITGMLINLSLTWLLLTIRIKK